MPTLQQQKLKIKGEIPEPKNYFKFIIFGLFVLAAGLALLAKKSENPNPPTPEEKISSEQKVSHQPDDDKLVKELAANFNQFKNSMDHVSAAARVCAMNPSSNACELLQQAYYNAYRYHRAVPVVEAKVTPKNVPLRDLARNGKLGSWLFHLLKKKHKGVGRILSTDRVSDLGKKVFVEKAKSWQISGADIRELEWVLVLQGYSLKQWEQNEGYKNVEALRPQIEKVPETSPIDNLPASLNTRTVLKRKMNFEEVGDLVEFIKIRKANWEPDLEILVGKSVVKDTKDGLSDAGYQGLLDQYERQ